MIDKKKIFIGIIVIASFIIGIFFYKKKNNQSTIVLNEVFVETSKVENTIELEKIKIKIHITGEVNQPGLIELEVGERVKDAIDMCIVAWILWPDEESSSSPNLDKVM